MVPNGRGVVWLKRPPGFSTCQFFFSTHRGFLLLTVTIPQIYSSPTPGDGRYKAVYSI